MTTEATTYDKKFNAQRGAQRTVLKPGEFERLKTPDGRFGWRAIAPAGDYQVPIQITEPEQATSPTSQKPGKRQAIIEQAQAVTLPAAPDFSKPTHARFRAKLAKLVELAEASEIDGLKAVVINQASMSPKAMARYRDCAFLAMEARVAGRPTAQTAS